jgi:hypothetical protein
MTVTKVTGMMQTSTKGGDISSASPTVIDTDGDYFDVTGTTNFAAFTVVAGRRFTVQFDGVLTMTHDATILDLPGGASITTAAGDVAEFFATGTNTVQCVNYTKADGTAIVAGASGDLRNFIIDGDFTQWPTGTAFSDLAHATYASALWQHQGVSGLFDFDRSTSVPTVAQSSHQSTYSIEVDCHTADGSPGSTDYQEMRYYITGSDLAFIHQQTVTLAFWWYSTVTGTNSGTIRNSAQDRVYPFSFTVSSTNTWEYKTITIALDTSGTWLFTEADIGMMVTFNLLSGSGRTATANTWGGTFATGATSTANHASSTSNYVRVAQVGLYLGSSAPTFLGGSIATVEDQVAYYVEQWNYNNGSNQYASTSGFFRAANHLTWVMQFKPKRVVPTCSASNADTFETIDSGGTARTPTSATVAFGFHTKHSVRFGITAFSSAAYGGCTVQRNVTDTCYVMFDARH